MVRRKQRREHRHRRQAVRPVLVVLPPLVQHDVALIGELRLGQRRQQVPHPIRFHPQRELERVGRHDFPVVRAIGVGRSVQRGAGALQRLESSRCRGAPIPRTSGARTGARSRCGPGARSSTRRDTRGSRRRSGRRDPRAGARRGRSRACASLKEIVQFRKLPQVDASGCRSRDSASVAVSAAATASGPSGRRRRARPRAACSCMPVHVGDDRFAERAELLARIRQIAGRRQLHGGRVDLHRRRPERRRPPSRYSPALARHARRRCRCASAVLNLQVRVDDRRRLDAHRPRPVLVADDAATPATARADIRTRGSGIVDDS